MENNTATGKIYDFEISANFDDASSLIQYRLSGDDEWRGTPFQVADSRHDEATAYAIVDGWLDSQA